MIFFSKNAGAFKCYTCGKDCWTSNPLEYVYARHLAPSGEVSVNGRKVMFCSYTCMRAFDAGSKVASKAPKSKKFMRRYKDKANSDIRAMAAMYSIKQKDVAAQLGIGARALSASLANPNLSDRVRKKYITAIIQIAEDRGIDVNG